MSEESSNIHGITNSSQKSGYDIKDVIDIFNVG